jgi:hypothetical protein
MTCSGIDKTIKKIALGFVLLFLTGFLLIYYEVRRLICATTELCYAPFFGYSRMAELDMIVAVFVIGTLFFSFALYYSSNGGE